MIGVFISVNNFVCLVSITDAELEDKYVLFDIVNGNRLGRKKIPHDITRNIVGTDMYGSDISDDVIVLSSDYRNLFDFIVKHYKFIHI